MHGSDVCIENIKNKKVFMIIISNDASQNTKDRFKRLSEEYSIKYIEYGEKEFLSKSIGKEEKVVLGVLDDGFSKKILQLLNELKGDIV